MSPTATPTAKTLEAARLRKPPVRVSHVKDGGTNIIDKVTTLE
ncbi:hypothetical protein BH20VER1_BH20VER1_05200 [soil metagenome]